MAVSRPFPKQQRNFTISPSIQKPILKAYRGHHNYPTQNQPVAKHRGAYASLAITVKLTPGPTKYEHPDAQHKLIEPRSFWLGVLFNNYVFCLIIIIHEVVRENNNDK